MKKNDLATGAAILASTLAATAKAQPDTRDERAPQTTTVLDLQALPDVPAATQDEVRDVRPKPIPTAEEIAEKKRIDDLAASLEKPSFTDHIPEFIKNVAPTPTETAYLAGGTIVGLTAGLVAGRRGRKQEDLEHLKKMKEVLTDQRHARSEKDSGPSIA